MPRLATVRRMNDEDGSKGVRCYKAPEPSQLAIAADRVLAVDTTQTPNHVTRWALDGSSEVLATVDPGSIRALDDDGTAAAVVQHACGQERVVLLTGGTGPADLTSAACPGP